MAVAQIEFARTKPNGRKPLAIAEKSKLLMTEFQALADISIRPSTMTEGEFAIKKVHAYEKKHFLETFALLLLTSTGAERAMVENYLHRTIDGADETWDGLDPVKRFKEFQQSCASHAVSSVSLSSLPDVMTDNTVKDLKRLSSNVALLKKQLKKARKEVTTTTVNTATASHSDGSGSSTKIKAKTCGYCGRKKHDQSVCFSNPHTSPEQRQRAAEHQDRYPSWKPLPALPSYVRVYATQLLLLEADPALSGLSEEGKQNLIKQILLDGGSDACILNRFYRHLFFRITKLTHRCLLSGIGGDTDLKITHSGSISFMGCIIQNVYYCAELSKSIVSESVLCQVYNFRILKEDNSCIITNY